MIILFVLLAIAIGLGIARKYSPTSKIQKVVTSILFPVIIGVMINVVVAAALNDKYNNFWYSYGSAFAFVGIPTLALIITLLVKVKVAEKQDATVESRIQKLHYGTGENRVDFEMELTEQEISKMEELRKRDPERWVDNDLELIKAVNRELLGKTPIHEEVPQQLCKNSAEEKTVQTLHYGTGKNRVDFEMELTDSEIRKMEELRRDNPEKWLDNDLELVKAAKKAFQEGAVDEGQETLDARKDEFASVENEPVETLKEQVDEKSKEDIRLNGAKLESEYRKELTAGQHWIRQNGTEMCINIDDVTYQRMIKMQNENPKKWVDNEFNLFLAAKAYSNSNDHRNKKTRIWFWVLGCIVGTFVLYGIIASTVDNTVATCNETVMHDYYEDAKYIECVSCNYSVFRYRMIANTLYRKKMYNLFEFKDTSYDDFCAELNIKNRMENPFVWVW